MPAGKPLVRLQIGPGALPTLPLADMASALSEPDRVCAEVGVNTVRQGGWSGQYPRPPLWHRAESPQQVQSCGTCALAPMSTDGGGSLPSHVCPGSPVQDRADDLPGKGGRPPGQPVAGMVLAGLSEPASLPPSVTESSFQATLGCLIFGRETWVNELLGSTCAADPQMTASCR